MGLDIPGICYSAALVGGGIMGFVKKGSVMSGVAGVSLGTLAGYGAYEATHHNSYQVGLGNSLVVSTAMGVRWLKSRGNLPLGIGLASLGMAAYYGFNELKKESPGEQN